ncbi:MAG TPA: hypothetical protein VNQ78_09840 [Paracoccus sp. (in: a-proteobacteria)]|nr:hypothetical protein [Paracoccus sp. (in: a-proteobacteria)]
MALHGFLPLPDTRAAEVTRLTGFAPRWVSPLPVPCWHALCWHGADFRRAGLVWDASGLHFAVLTFDDRLARHYNLGNADLATAGLEALGIMETRGIPRAFRRSVRVKRIPAERVTAG